jgi:hypothetical protein
MRHIISIFTISALTIFFFFSFVPSFASASEVVISGTSYTVGNSLLQDYLSKRDDFVHELHFSPPAEDINVIYLLNATRVFLKEENIVTIQGVDINGLNVDLHNKPYMPSTYLGLVSLWINGGRLSQADTTSFSLDIPSNTTSVTFTPVTNDPGTVIKINGDQVNSGMTSNQISISHGDTILLETKSLDGTEFSYNIMVSKNSSMPTDMVYRSFYFKTDYYMSNYITVYNSRVDAVSFQINLNNSLFLSKDEIAAAVTSLKDDYANEPIQRKAWRFARDNRYHWTPISFQQWKHDPLLFLNSIGFGFCGEAAALYFNIMTLLGYTARVWGIEGHIIPEVFINNRWELYDPDLEVYYYNRSDEIAGVEELANDPTLITDPINPVNANSWPYSSAVADLYATTSNNFLAPWYEANPVADYLLQFHIPPNGTFEFPGVFAAPLQTIYSDTTPKYTNARLVVPKGSSFDVEIPLVVHTITLATTSPASQLVVATDVLSPQSVGKKITFTATASGGTGYYEFYFTLRDPNTGTWSVGQAYSVKSSWTWDTAGLTPGTYAIQVWVKNAGSTASYEAYQSMSFTLNTPPLPVTDLTVSMDKATPQSVGAKVTVSAAASGGSGNYEYYFTLRDPAGVWTVPQPYSSYSSWTWDTVGLATGAYTIQVWARSVGSLENHEADWSISYSLNTPPPPVTALTVAMDKSTPQSVGAKVTFSAAALGGSGNFEYYFTVRDPNTGTWSVPQPYSVNSIWTWDTTGLGTGVYTIQVWARSVGSLASYEAYKSISYMLNTPPPPVTGVILSMDKVSPQSVGAKVAFRAAATGDSGNYEYYFTLLNPNTGIWSVGQAYSGNSIWTWDTTGLGTGAYTIQVWARSVGSLASYEAYKSISYTLNTPPPPVSGVILSMDKVSPQLISVKAAFSAVASGGSGNYEYCFMVRDPNTGAWSVPQPYSVNSIWTWDTTGLGAGAYTIQVWARSVGSPSAYEAYKSISYTLNTPPPPITGVTLVMDKVSPQSVGAKVTFNAAATGGSGTYEYYFAVRDPNTGAWSVGQAYSGTSRWIWDTTGLGTGVYTIQVWARNVGSSSAYEAYKSISYTLNTPPLPVTDVLLSMDNVSPQSVGAIVAFSAAATGGSGNYEYYFTVRDPNTGTWSVGQAYSGTSSWTWDTTGLGIGAYTIQVWARSVGSLASYEAYKSISFTLNTPPPPVTGMTVTMDNVSPQSVGAIVAFTASATGGSENYEYYFTVRDPNTGTWSVGQAYSGTSSWTWDTTGLGTGAYTIQVWARSIGSPAAYEAYKSISYTLN